MTEPFYIEHLTKKYEEQAVLCDLSLTFLQNHIYCIMAPSGTGKTTLFRLLMGLEKPDSGSIGNFSGKRFSAVFQEDRLLPGLTAPENIRFAAGSRYSLKEIRSIAAKLLPEDSLDKPVHEFSGGMKRRTAILRALLSPSDVIIMDEPFSGLDEAAKAAAISMIKEYRAGRLLLVATHAAEDAAMLGGEKILL